MGGMCPARSGMCHHHHHHRKGGMSHRAMGETHHRKDGTPLAMGETHHRKDGTPLAMGEIHHRKDGMCPARSGMCPARSGMSHHRKGGMSHRAMGETHHRKDGTPLAMGETHHPKAGMRHATRYEKGGMCHHRHRRHGKGGTDPTTCGIWPGNEAGEHRGHPVLALPVWSAAAIPSA